MTSTDRLNVSLVAAAEDPRYLALDPLADRQLFTADLYEPDIPDVLWEMVGDDDFDRDGRIYRTGYTDDWDVQITVGSVRPFCAGPWLLVEARAVIVDGQGCEIYAANLAEEDLAGMLGDFRRLTRELHG